MSQEEVTILGLDLGSTAAKSVEVKFTGNKKNFHIEVSSKKVVPSARWSQLISWENLEEMPVVATGYFRKKVRDAMLRVTEITTAREGAGYFFPDFDVVLDIGGQDIKLFDRRTNHFKLNDKCSAGTGAFFDFVANYFGVEVSALSILHFQAERYPRLNSTCTVFALSEIISRLVEGYTKEEVIRGMHFTFGEKIASLLPECEEIVLIGGVSLNKGVAD
ncbi:MAG TPA: hypothetical protein EYP29_00470, partial [Thermoplasmata archaeon]|nr:hypothetical protein [Thermoplasmata archaeon]